jgi:hypothetical protein
MVIEPAAARDEFGARIAEVSGRTATRSQAALQKKCRRGPTANYVLVLRVMSSYRVVHGKARAGDAGMGSKK